MKKRTKQTVKKTRKIKLLKRDKETIFDQFSSAVRTAIEKQDRVFFTKFVEELVRKMFNQNELDIYNKQNLLLCASVSNGSVRIRDKNDRWLSCDVCINPRKEFRVPDELSVKPSDVNLALQTQEKSKDKRQKAESLARAIIGSCQTTDDLKNTWPQGKVFWQALVGRLEHESQTPRCLALIPISKIKELNQFSKDLLSGGENER